MHRFGAVALVGRPNAGKSTLVNQLVGEKISIVTDKPQTTRTRIMGIVTRPDWQMVIYDAPGIHKPKDSLGRSMVHTALGVLGMADILYYIVDATEDFGPGEAYILQVLEKTAQPVFLLLNKADRMKKDDFLPLIAAWRDKREFAHIFPLSALKGDNIAPLLAQTAVLLPEGPRCYDEDEMTDQPARVMAAELIREQANNATRQEIPYAVAVFVEKMEERRPGLMDIYAVLVVDQESRKGILIGKQGATLKEIGTQARRDIEDLLGTQVNLRLFVQVRENWRNKQQHLKAYLE